MKKLFFTSTLVFFLFLFSLSFVSASHDYTDDYNSFKPTYYTISGESFHPYHSANSYYPTYSYYPNSYYPTYSYYPNSYYYPPYYSASPYYYPKQYHRPSNAVYSTPIYLNKPALTLSSVANTNNYLPYTFTSKENAFDNDAFSNFNQNARINSQDFFSFTKTPCQTHKRILDFDGKKNDIFDFYEVCDGTTVRQNTQDSFSNSINNNYGFSSRDFGNSQYFSY